MHGEPLPFGQPVGSVIQVAYIVPDLEAAVRAWATTLGIGPFFVIEHFPLIDHHYRGRPQALDINLALAFSGSMSFELIQQNDDAPSTYRDVIKIRGYGFHHWGIGTREFDRDVARYHAGGYELASSATVGNTGGARGAYFDTVAALGGMVELIEMLPAVEQMFTAIRRAADGWDGRDPIRRF